MNKMNEIREHLAAVKAMPESDTLRSTAENAALHEILEACRNGEITKEQQKTLIFEWFEV